MTDPRLHGAPSTPPVLWLHAAAYPAGTRHQPHRHDDLHFSMVLSGTVAEVVGGVSEHAGALSVVAKDPGVVHANDFGAGARLARLTLPGVTLGSLLDDPARMGGWRWTHDVRVAAPFLRLVRRSNDRPASYAATDPDLVDLLAAFTAHPVDPPRGHAPAWVADVMDEVQDGWRPRLGVADLARRAGVHPVYLARCVRRWFGTSLGAALRQQRLRAAAAGIAASRRTISDLAHASGFSDEPHLIREFRTAVGMTPGRYRRLLRLQEFNRRGIA